nr:TPA_asm: hypothetical protein [Pemphredonvirus anglici]
MLLKNADGSENSETESNKDNNEPVTDVELIDTVLVDKETCDVIDPNASDKFNSPYITHICKCHSFKKFNAPADGNCMLHSVLYLLDLQHEQTVYQMRLVLLYSPYLEKVSNPFTCRSILSSNDEWCDYDVLTLISIEYEVNICVHDIINNLQYIFKPQETTDSIIHLEYNGNHYNGLIAMAQDDDSETALDGNIIKIKNKNKKKINNTINYMNSPELAIGDIVSIDIAYENFKILQTAICEEHPDKLINQTGVVIKITDDVIRVNFKNFKKRYNINLLALTLIKKNCLNHDITSLNEVDYDDIPFFPLSKQLTPILQIDDSYTNYPYVSVELVNSSNHEKFKSVSKYQYTYEYNGSTPYSSLKQLVNKLHEKTIDNQRVIVLHNLNPTVFLKDHEVFKIFEQLPKNTNVRFIIYGKPSDGEFNMSLHNRSKSFINKKFEFPDSSFYKNLIKSSDDYTEFQVTRRSNTLPLNVMRNAIDEQREYWRVKEKILLKQYTDKYDELSKKILTKSVSKSLIESVEGYGILGVNGNWLCKPARTRKYEVAFNGYEFVDFTLASTGNSKTKNNQYFLVGSALELMQDYKLYSATENLRSDDFFGVQIECRQGVPGCGKTYNFLQTCVPPSTSEKGSLVLFPTREGCIDFREKILKKYPNIPSDLLKSNYRTLDSYLLHGDNSKYDTVMIDEALMVHAGQILLCVFKAKAENLIMIGDNRQIKFINRVPQCEIRYSDPANFVTANVHLSVSWRCTLTAATILSPFYEKGMKSISKITGEMHREQFLNINSIRHNDKAQYLVFKQSEKLEMIKLGFVNTFTIHEYQGKQAEHIIVVRTSLKKEDIYNSESHALVAISRHTKSFKYITPVNDDAISKMLISAQKINYHNSQKFLHNNLRGGGIPIFSISNRNTNIEIIRHENISSCTSKFGYPDIPTYTPVPVFEIPDEYASRPVVINENKTPDLSIIQEFYDFVFPGNSIHSLKYDSQHVLNGDMHYTLENTIFNPYQPVKIKSIIYDTMRPLLRTSVPPKRPNNQVETLLAMIKRNQSVPELSGVTDDEALARSMVSKFISTYLIRNSKSQIQDFKQNVITPNSASISDWLERQPSGTVDLIEQKNHFSMESLDRYQFMIKSTVKPQLDCNAPYTYNALQTIAYQDKNINVIFCPIFKDLRNRVISLLKSKYMINTEMTNEQLVQNMVNFIGKNRFLKKKFLEVDMSKYDKSQGKLALLFEIYLMREFGVDDEIVNLWWNAHVSTELTDRNNKAKCFVKYQRKSGDASTFIGNTFFLMAVIAMLFDLDNCVFAVFAGDDSLIVGNDDVDRDLNNICASMFNLESKFFRSYKYSYFCSKFLLHDEHGYLLIPDPLKLITKLGRSDLVNPDHVEEYRVSLADIVKPFANILIHDNLSAAINERYKISGNHSQIFINLYEIINDKDKFNSIFIFYPEDNINLDPSRPKLD